MKPTTPPTRRPTPAQRAREQAGFTLAEAARRAQVTVAYYRRCELANAFPFCQGLFLARLFGVAAWTFHKLALAHERERGR